MSAYLRPAGAVLCALVLLALTFAGEASAQPEPEEISDPALIPLLDDFHTPQIKPGNDGEITFELTNRYAYNITGLRLRLEIYRWADLDGAEAVEHLDEVPTFRGGHAEGSAAESNLTSVLFVFGSGMPSKHRVRVTANLHASVFSKVGTYMVRTFIRFDMENSTYWMRSRGFFDDDDWYAFEDHRNLTRLGQDSGLGSLHGILPDTSFGVKKGTDYTWFYVIVAVGVIFGGLSVFFYLMDEKGKFPNARRKLDDAWYRMRGIKPPDREGP